MMIAKTASVTARPSEAGRGQAGFAGHLTVGKGSMIAARTAIYSDEAPGSKLKGDPPMPMAQAQRVAALSKRLPEFFARLDNLEKRLPP